MERSTALSTALTLTAATGLFGWQALAQADDRPGQGNGMGDHSMMMDMSGMDMSKEMQMCMKMNMQAVVDPGDPAALLAVQDELSLSQDQARQLRDLAEQTRQAASDILNKEQRKQVEALPDEPQTMMQMHRQMMESSRNGGMMGADGGGKGMMSCPMMGMMKKGSGDAQGSDDQAQRDGQPEE